MYLLLSNKMAASYIDAKILEMLDPGPCETEPRYLHGIQPRVYNREEYATRILSVYNIVFTK